MGRGYYGVPGTAPDFEEDEEYYYEYEPILTQKNQKQQEAPGVGPAQIIIFLMGLPFLPIWSALAILGHHARISAAARRSPEETMQLQLELKGFYMYFVLGILLYIFFIPRLMDFYYSIP